MVSETCVLDCWRNQMGMRRSPFYLCVEHVDNLGAYTASRPETGLLIPSVSVSDLMEMLSTACGWSPSAEKQKGEHF